jgi:predicted amidophosphoribosyltransferase
MSEVRIFVRNDSPWIKAVCPNCGNDVRYTEHCPKCGQALSYRYFNTVLDDGGCSIELPPTWSELVIDRRLQIQRFMEGLKDLERMCNIKEDSILKIIRKEYIKTCFEKEQSL